ncbi:MAG: ATP-binding protein [Patescibacteria group bacterium]|nr:ATP-binding protein [Patescibacteria group bacterium]
MRRKRLFWQLYLLCLAITVGAVGMVALWTWPAMSQGASGPSASAASRGQLEAIKSRLAQAAMTTAFLAAGLSLVVCRKIARPFEDARRDAERMASGDFQHRLHASASQEMDGVAKTLNHLADQLLEQIRTLDAERNHRDAILTSMVEGVLAVDADQRLISVNRAGAALLGIDRAKATGRSLHEAVRNADLQQLVAEVLNGEQPQLAEIMFHGKEECVLEAHGTVLRSAGGQKLGALVVLHNVTQLRRLENVRRDFVANVSHELKTPVTSIKGFVETLLDGAMDNRDDAIRFLQIVAAQTDRLTMIIEDLLTLSRVEQEYEQAEIVLEPATIRNVLESAAAVCQGKAAKKDIRFTIDCQPDLLGMINPLLLEQAVVNLVDNAVKYSPAGATVELQAEASFEDVAIRVCDSGCGIPREHLSRIFERFYRVDKARSRSLGGTGLGLSIVKHIAQAHGGRAAVESTPGKGSTFTVFVRAA